MATRQEQPSIPRIKDRLGIEVKPLQKISVPDQWGEQENPLAGLEPLLWRCEDGAYTTHGGARAGSGRPTLGGTLVPVDMPTSMNTALKNLAQHKEISRSQLIRTYIEQGLKADGVVITQE